MITHDPNHVARIAASLLQGRDLSVEAHHARQAVESARLLLDEAHRQAVEAGPAREPETALEQVD